MGGAFFTTGLFTKSGKQADIDQLREELHQDVAHLEGEISENSSAIETNAAAIAENVTAIEANASAIEATNTALQTNYYTKAEVDAKVSAVYHFKGSVPTYADLPDEDLEVGDVYNIVTADPTHDIHAGDNVAWDGSDWDNLHGIIDLSAYATKEELNESVEGLENAISSAVTEAEGYADTQVNELQTHVWQGDLDSGYFSTQKVGTNGTAEIWNESDGGGSHFTHNDGSESYVGVHDGGQNGLMAQIYADKLVDGKWTGAKLDVKNTGMYYTVGDKSLAERTVPENEIATKGDITRDSQHIQDQIDQLSSALAELKEIVLYGEYNE